MIKRLLIVALLPVLAFGANVDVVRGYSAGAGAGSWTSTTTGTDVVWTFNYNNWTNTAVSPIYSNLLAWYDFATNGATSTNWADSSTNGYVAYSATTTNYGLTWSGANGGKIVMDGGTNGERGVTADALGSSGKFFSTNGTYAIWVRPNVWATTNVTSDGVIHRMIVAHPYGSSYTNTVRLSVGAAGNQHGHVFSATNSNTSVGDSPDIYPFDTNTWMHLAMSWACTPTTNIVQLWKNGVLISEVGKSFAVSNISYLIDIGRGARGIAQDKVRTWSGDIADVRFFNRALTTDEIRYWLYVPDKHGGTNYP